MIALPDLARRAFQACAFFTVLALAACGPGTGGTGTGPITGVFNQPGPVFSAGSPCEANCVGASLKLEIDRVEFTAPCQRFVYVGPWGVDEDGTAVLDGTLETTDVLNGQHQIAGRPAVMRLQFGPATATIREVALTVRDATGANLMAPVTLRQGTRAAVPATCGADRTSTQEIRGN